MNINGTSIRGVWESNLTHHPKCPHGPTLLFERTHSNGEITHFYACSACRDRKLCNFYLEKDQEMTKNQKNSWELQIKKLYQSYNHRKCFIRFNQLLGESEVKRSYCHTCERLTSIDENFKHKDHQLKLNISDDQMNNPTTFLNPLSNSKKEAQYLFSKKATREIVDMIRSLGFKAVLCIGAPRIHEFLNQNYEEQVSSLLLDFDGRYHNFFGPLNYCWYNLFNHHFFNNESKQVFKEFLTQNNGKDILIICDPPFGGRVEFISRTLKTISDLHKKWNNLTENNELKIIFIFPYFMESIMKYKSNPDSINGGLKDLKMADYKVDYDNHPLFITDSNKGRKFGSPVRIFTNIPLNLLKLPEEDGYKYCKRCLKWVSAENKHCKKCKACTSKDGRRYKHCKTCDKCVKPTWKHCKVCNRCALENHSCEFKPKLSKSSIESDEIDVSDVEDDNHDEEFVKPSLKSGLKRKKNTDHSSIAKKQKVSSDLSLSEKKVKKKKSIISHKKSKINKSKKELVSY